MRRGIAFLLTIVLLMGAFSAMGENGTEQTSGAHDGEGGGETAQQTSEAESDVVAPVPFGESFTLETEVTEDGFPRREAGTEPYETLSFTLKIDGHRGPDYFKSEYVAMYKLRGNEAVVQFEITLNDYSGALRVVPQNALDVVLMSETEGNINEGYQLMDEEIAGTADISVASGVATTLYKRYDYDPEADPLRYLLVIAHVGGKQIPYLFDIGPVSEWYLMIGSEGEEVSRLQRALISRGILQGAPDGKFGIYTADAVKIMQGLYGLERTGIVNWVFLSRLYEDCGMQAVNKEAWEKLGIPEGSISSSDPEKITKLDLSNSDIRGFDALSEFPNLTELDLSSSGISDLSGLSGLTNLTTLSLNGNEISNLSGLSGLTNLTKLSLVGNKISDISGLSGLTNLEDLDLSDNSISDIGALRELTDLQKLVLSDNMIGDIDALSRLMNLEYLNLDDNMVMDVRALSGLTNLESLNLYDNKIIDLSALSGLTNLKSLNLCDNRIIDISALSGLTNLEWLDLVDNKISDFSALKGLINLKTLFYLDHILNEIF